MLVFWVVNALDLQVHTSCEISSSHGGEHED
jgi:hypothetical protein